MIIDLTKPIYHGMAVYPGDPLVELKEVASIEIEGYSNYLFKTSMHAGTHVDGLGHMLEHQPLIGEYPLSDLIGRARKIDAHAKEIPNDVDFLVIKGQTILDLTWVKTHLHKPLKGIVLETDSPDQEPYLVHKHLFQEGIIIVENATNFESLPKHESFNLYIIPLKIEADSSPCRVFVTL